MNVKFVIAHNVQTRLLQRRLNLNLLTKGDNDYGGLEVQVTVARVLTSDTISLHSDTGRDKHQDTSN